MKKGIEIIRNQYILACLCIFASVSAFAQDATESHTTHTSTSSETLPTNNDWMSNPWIWVGGGIVLLLILIAVFSSRSSGNSSEIKRTSITRTEVSND